MSTTQDPAINLAYSHVLSTKHYLIFRAFTCIYFWALQIAVLSIYGIDQLIYFTTWTLIVCCIYMTFAFYSTYMYYKHSISANDVSDYHQKCIKGCSYGAKAQSIATAASLSVVIAFWSLFGHLIDPSEPTVTQTHGVACFFTVADFYLCFAMVSFKKTWWYLFVYSLIYVIFSIIFRFAADKSIYPVLDWRNGIVQAIITSVAIIVLSQILHIVLCWTKNKLITKRAGIVQTGNNDDENENGKDIELENAGNGRTTAFGTNLTNDKILVEQVSVDMDSDGITSSPKSNDESDTQVP